MHDKKTKELVLLKELHAAYGADKDLLAEATQFAASTEGADFETVKAHVEQFRVKIESDRKDAKDARIKTLEEQLSLCHDEIEDLKAEIITFNP